MFQLTNEERLAIARRVVEKAAGRVPVVAGGECHLSDSCRLRMWLVRAIVWLVSNPDPPPLKPSKRKGRSRSGIDNIPSLPGSGDLRRISAAQSDWLVLNYLNWTSLLQTT